MKVNIINNKKHEYIVSDYIEVKQPIGSFYLTKLSWKNLLTIAEADIRKIEDENKKKDSFDSYLGIQREVSESRVKEIAQYVTTVDATFPTSIILSIPSKEYHYNGHKINIQKYEELDKIKEYKEIDNICFESGKLKIRKCRAIASILDGQHRIEGLKRAYQINQLPGFMPDFELNVTLFVDLDIDDQAQIFSVINKAQTKVNKSLVYDLYDYAKSRSPQKTAHDIVRLLNHEPNSPFFQKIKILGKAIDSSKETITQATFVELILGYISNNPMIDRDLLKRNKKIDTSLDTTRYIFREFFVQEKDEYILKILWNYFTAAKNVWPNSWKTVENGNILNKSTGIIALMRLLGLIYNSYEIDQNTSAGQFAAILKGTKINDGDFTISKYIPGSSGHSQLFSDLKKCIDN